MEFAQLQSCSPFSCLCLYKNIIVLIGATLHHSREALLPALPRKLRNLTAFQHHRNQATAERGSLITYQSLFQKSNLVPVRFNPKTIQAKMIRKGNAYLSLSIPQGARDPFGRRLPKLSACLLPSSQQPNMTLTRMISLRSNPYLRH